MENSEQHFFDAISHAIYSGMHMYFTFSVFVWDHGGVALKVMLFAAKSSFIVLLCRLHREQKEVQVVPQSSIAEEGQLP